MADRRKLDRSRLLPVKQKGPPIPRRPLPRNAIDQNRLPALKRNHSKSSVFVFVSAWAKSARRSPIGELQRTDPPTDDLIEFTSTMVPVAPGGGSTPHNEPASTNTPPFRPKSGGTPGAGNPPRPCLPRSSCRRSNPSLHSGRSPRAITVGRKAADGFAALEEIVEDAHWLAQAGDIAAGQTEARRRYRRSRQSHDSTAHRPAFLCSACRRRAQQSPG